MAGVGHAVLITVHCIYKNGTLTLSASDDIRSALSKSAASSLSFTLVCFASPDTNQGWIETGNIELMQTLISNFTIADG